MKQEFLKWLNHCKIVMQKGHGYNTAARNAAMAKVKLYYEAYKNKPDGSFKNMMRVLRTDLETLLPHTENKSYQSSLNKLNELLNA